MSYGVSKVRSNLIGTRGSCKERPYANEFKATLSQLDDLIDEYELPADPKRKAELIVPTPGWRLSVSASPSTKPTPLTLSQRIKRNTTKATKWASAQQERAQKLLADLKGFNDDLFMFSGQPTGGLAGHSGVPERILAHVFDEANLKMIVEATTLYDPEFAICARFKLEVITATRATSASGTRSSTAVGGRPPLKILPTRISKRRPTDLSRLIAAEHEEKSTGQSKPVLLEDKSYAGRPPEYERFVEARVNELAMILLKSPKPARLRALDCAGYVHNRKGQSFSLVFHYPKDAATDADPLSLSQLLPRGPTGWSQRYKQQIGRAPRSIKPALQTRFHMAKSIANSLSLLQACGMLHKGLSPFNIIFFKSTTPGANSVDVDRDLTSPYIAGFSWARLHGAEFISDEYPANDFTSTSGLLHVHPAYSFTAEQRYLKLFDIYSLGLVLLQIGMWQSLRDIADELFPSVKSAVNAAGAKLDEVAETSALDKWVVDSITKWQDELAKHQHVVDQSDGIAGEENPRVAFQKALVENVERMLVPVVGEIYAKVVKRCLTGDVENDGMPAQIVEAKTDEEVPEQILQDAIVRNVMEELDKCNA